MHPRSLRPVQSHSLSNRRSIHKTTNIPDLQDLKLLDVPGLTAAIAIIRPAYILLVHIDAHVPEVLEAIVHGNPLRGLALAYEEQYKSSVHYPGMIDLRGSRNSPLIQTEYLFSLDHEPSLAFSDGTTWWVY